MVSIGYSSQTWGEAAIAIGKYAYTSFGRNISIGGGADSQSGKRCETRATYSVALGFNACVSSGNAGSIALGYMSKTSRQAELSVGSGPDGSIYNTRLIANVTDGLLPTDAATVGQLPTTMTGASSSVAGTGGLVPAPAAGDDTKFLAGDGTWKTAGGGGATVTDFYVASAFSKSGQGSFTLYKDSSLTTVASNQDFVQAMNDSVVRIIYSNTTTNWLEVYYPLAVNDDGGTSILTPDSPDYWFACPSSNAIVDIYWSSDPPAYGWVELQEKLTAGSNITIGWVGGVPNTISATDTTYSDFTGATASVAGAHGLVPAPAAGDEGKALHGDGTWKDTTAKLVEMSYGESSAWAKFIAAYNAGSIVYCRASSNANPGSGSQTRKAFMAYVNNAANPTTVEFQYVRSVSSKSASQPVDQVFVYTLTNANGGTWSVATRDMGPKTAAGTGIGVNYSSGTYTISANAMTGATSSTAGAAGIVPAPAAGDDTKFLAGDGTWKTAGGGKEVTIVVSDLRPSQYFPDAFLELQMTDYPAAQQYESNLNGNFYGTSGYFAFLNEDLDHYLTIDELGGYFRDGYKINVVNGLNMYGGSTALQNMTISGMVLNASDRYNEFVLMTINSDQIGNQYMGILSTRKAMNGGNDHNIYTGRIS